MLDELHRLGFEQLRFATLDQERLFLYAAIDEAEPSSLDGRFIPAARQFSYPFFSTDPINGTHLREKWDRLLVRETKPNHLAGMFILDFPDIARHGFGPDLLYRQWFKGLRPALGHDLLPITHPEMCFAAPYNPLEWATDQATPHPSSYPAAPANGLLSGEPVPPTERREPDYRTHKFTARALLMLNELHRFGFEQLRFQSYGGHGFVHIFAARDEMPVSFSDPRFLPAVRKFSTLPDYEHLTAGSSELAHAWLKRLHGGTPPNQLAGLFLLDYPEVARYGFGADGPYREWFRALQPFLQSGLLPITHRDFSHANPHRTLAWEAFPPVAPNFSGPPPNPYLNPTPAEEFSL